MNNKGKISLIAGVSGFIFLFLYIIRFSIIKYSTLWQSSLLIDYIFVAFFYSAWLVDIIGIIFGITSLKSKEKKLAQTGIVLSVLGLLEYPLLYYILAKMFGMMP